MALLQTVISASSMGDNTVIPGVAGQVIQIVGIFFVCNIATTLTIKDGGSNLTGPMSFTGGGGMSLDSNIAAGNPIFECATGDSFIFHFSGLTGQASGVVWYYQQ